MKSIRLFHLICTTGFVALASVAPLRATDYHMLPLPTGSGSGLNDFNNAMGVANLGNMLNSVLKPGDTLKLGSGNYGNNPITITASGTAALRKSLVGVNTGAGFPSFTGSSSVVNLKAGASYWTIANLSINQTSYGFRADGANRDLILDGISVRTTTQAGFQFKDCDNLLVQNCKSARFERKGFFCISACNGVVFRRCIADGTGVVAPDFAWWGPNTDYSVGFDFHESGSTQPENTNVLLEDCEAFNIKDPRPVETPKFPQGDGFKTEGRNDGFTFVRCRSFQNMDANYDLKGANHLLISCFAGGGPLDLVDPGTSTAGDEMNLVTRHGFKCWGVNAVLKNCIASGNGKQFFHAYQPDLTQTPVVGREMRLERCTLYCETPEQNGSYINYTGNNKVVMHDCIIAYAGTGSAYAAQAGNSKHELINTLRLRNTALPANQPQFTNPIIPGAGAPTGAPPPIAFPWNGLGDNMDNAAITASGTVGYSSKTDVISYNLTEPGNALGAFAFLGYVPAINWNSSTANSQTLSNVRNAAGVPTTADLSSSSTAFNYSNNTGALLHPMDDDAQMMRWQRGLSNSASMAVTAVQVPYAKYDVYVYWGGRSPVEAASVMTVEFQQLTAGVYTTTATKYIRDSNYVWDGTYNESDATSAATATDGNEFVLFRDVNAAQFRIRATGGNRSGISGLQIVKK